MSHKLDPNQLDTLLLLLRVIARNWRPRGPVMTAELSACTYTAPPAALQVIREVAELRGSVQDAHERCGLFERALEICEKLLRIALRGPLAWQDWTADDQRGIEEFVHLAYEKVIVNGGFEGLAQRIRADFFDRTAPPAAPARADVSANQTVCV